MVSVAKSPKNILSIPATEYCLTSGSRFRLFFTLTYKQMSSDIISKLKGIIKSNGQYKRNRKYRNKNMQESKKADRGESHEEVWYVLFFADYIDMSLPGGYNCSQLIQREMNNYDVFVRITF